jgi:hypothetical protein
VRIYRGHTIAIDKCDILLLLKRMNLIGTNPTDKGAEYHRNEKSTGSEIGQSRHKPTADASLINKAVDRAIKDKVFLNKALESIKKIRFPVYKIEIIDYLKKATNTDNDIIWLFESLDGYIQYIGLDQIGKAIGQNNPEKRLELQISDEKRGNPNVRTGEAGANECIKSREAVSRSEERKDYPEVTPTAMTFFTCDMCGKQFQNPDDLVQHKRFEKGE